MTTITLKQRVTSDIERAQKFDSTGNVTMRDQVLREMYDLRGATIRYIDAAIIAAGFRFFVDARKRVIGQ